MLALCAVFTLSAQQSLNLVKQKLMASGFSEQDVKDVLITNEYTDKHNGVTHVYFKQVVNGIEVENAVGAIHYKGEVTFGFNQQFVHQATTKINTNQASITPSVNITTVASHLQLKAPSSLNKTALVLVNGKCELTDLSVSPAPIKVKLCYRAMPEGTLLLVYETGWYDQASGEWWMVYTDALTGAIVDKHSLTIKCNLSHQHGFSESPVQVHYPTIKNNIEGYIVAKKASNKATYRAYPLGVESPAHGERVLLTEPADSLASPYGWHDIDGIEGADETITYGNNVLASEDRMSLNTPGYSPDGGDSLVFDYPYDTLQTPSYNLNAAITNLFVWNNYLHDVTYHYGFDENSGNFQLNNYSRGGEENDFVYAEAQDGSGTNNANFATPVDGLNPRMQMYLWNRSGISLSNLMFINTTNSRDSFSYFISSFGPRTFSLTNIPMVLVADSAGGNTTLACNPVKNAAGKILVIDRGTCGFTQKVRNAQEAGAVMAIVINNVNTTAFAMTGSASDIVIPSVMISLSAGTILKQRLAAGEVFMSIDAGAEPAGAMDSDFDNGVIAHEYGHGISNRLTGGPDNANCLRQTQQEQAGEGWSDFFALVLTQRASHNAETGRGIATWLIQQPNEGLGIRNFRYSRSLTVNPTTYESIKTLSVPHGVGSVWCAMLYDLYWNFIDKYGYDPNLYTGKGGNNRAIQLVMDGMKLQPCSPGFVDARDAILLANKINNNGEDTMLIWSTFARRGLGFSAKQGSTSSRSDGTQAFDLPVSTSTSVTKINQSSGMAFWPNPSTGNIELLLPEASTQMNISIYDLSGRIVFETVKSGQTTVSLDLSGLANGLYQIRLVSGDKTFTDKLIIAH